MFIKPKAGLKIRHPKSKLFLKEEGEEVLLSTFWRRRLQDGDVVEVVKSEVKEKVVDSKKEVSKKEVKVSN